MNLNAHSPRRHFRMRSTFDACFAFRMENDGTYRSTHPMENLNSATCGHMMPSSRETARQRGIRHVSSNVMMLLIGFPIIILKHLTNIISRCTSVIGSSGCLKTRTRWSRYVPLKPLTQGSAPICGMHTSAIGFVSTERIPGYPRGQRTMRNSDFLPSCERLQYQF